MAGSRSLDPLITFYLYSTDASPNVDPYTASSYIVFPQPAWNAGPFDSSFVVEPPNGRGEIIETLGGIVVQDLGVPTNLVGGRIKFSDKDALDQETKDALDLLYGATGVQYYFFNGKEIYKVAFSRSPAGLKTYRNLLYAQNNLTYYSYEIELVILEQMTLDEVS